MLKLHAGVKSALVRLAVVVSTVFSPSLLSAEPIGIVGLDDRQIFDADEQPELNAIGRLNVEGRGFCSAVLISPSEILTAAHCVWDWRNKSLVPPDMLHFVPGYRRGRHLGHARGVSIQTSTTLGFNESGRTTDPKDDWAVIELEMNITAGTGVRPIPMAGRRTILSLDEDSHLVRAGYGADRPHLPVRVSSCSLRAMIEQRRLLVHDCDATNGDSGSPIMVAREGRLSVVGVHSAIATYDEKWLGIAVVLARQPPDTTVFGIADQPAPESQ